MQLLDTDTVVLLLVVAYLAARMSGAVWRMYSQGPRFRRLRRASGRPVAMGQIIRLASLRARIKDDGARPRPSPHVGERRPRARAQS